MKLSLKSADLSLELKDEKQYKQRLGRAQLQLLYIQRQMYQRRLEAILVFEGWDASGKGGSIRRLVERLDPRGYVVHPIGAPSDNEKNVHYLQRFWSNMPGPGRIAVFDRSWYGRVLVERVEKLAKKPVWKRAFKEINAFEEILTSDGVPVVKFFLHIDKEEQLRRFEDRQRDPFKQWKITKDDWRNREKWDDYEEAIDEMLAKTSTRHAPWNLIAANHKWYARVAVCEIAAEALARFHKCEKKLPKGWRQLAQ